MGRIVGGVLFLCGILALGACGGDDPGFDEIECMPVGHWLAEEERVESDCGPDRLHERTVVLEISETDMPVEPADGALLRFHLTRGDERLESCSGIPSETGCRFDITCYGRDAIGPISYTLTVELGEAGTLTGTSIVSTEPGPDEARCQASFNLTGEQVSPLELEGAEIDSP